MYTSEQNDLIFALDIGTRSVTGIVGRSIDGLFQVEAAEMREHPQRAMMDGQIEDIQAVSKIAEEVKNALCERLDTKLTSVSVAAAGRALRTTRAYYEAEIAAPSVTNEYVAQLEMNALSVAERQIKENEGSAELLCVGHSVVKYSIDGYAYSNIIDHKGSIARVDIIATFLPAPVVTSLEAAMQKISLSVESLTLEPIAAMNAVIPKELRLLNLALVDIGAGTSDIAICDEGTIAAYTMATIAGDEITESIIRFFLVDFETAERIKHEAASGEREISYVDIMGFEYKQSLDSVIKAISPALAQLTDTICEKIVEVNGKTPAAVFLVGGGSRTPLLCQLVAKRLGLDERKVALGGNNFMKKLAVSKVDVYGPEYATPLGIAFTAAENTNSRAFDIELNGERKRLMRIGALTFIDVLLLCGFSYSDIMGKGGRGITYELNGVNRSARGGMMRPASLLLNGEKANISSKVISGDVLHFAPAVNGNDADLRVCDIVHENESFEVLLNGAPKRAGLRVLVNGIQSGFDRKIQEKDKVETFFAATLDTFLAAENISGEESTFFINGSNAGLSRELIAGDIITQVKNAKPLFDEELYTMNDAPVKDAQNAAGELQPQKAEESVDAEENAEAEESVDAEENAQAENPQAAANAEKPSPQAITPDLRVCVNGHTIAMPAKEDGTKYLFLDMLELVDIDPTKPQGDIVLLLNRKSASFLDEISQDDTVDIYWKKR